MRSSARLFCTHADRAAAINRARPGPFDCILAGEVMAHEESGGFSSVEKGVSASRERDGIWESEASCGETSFCDVRAVVYCPTRRGQDILAGRCVSYPYLRRARHRVFCSMLANARALHACVVTRSCLPDTLQALEEVYCAVANLTLCRVSFTSHFPVVVYYR